MIKPKLGYHTEITQILASPDVADLVASPDQLAASGSWSGQWSGDETTDGIQHLELLWRRQ